MKLQFILITFVNDLPTRNFAPNDLSKKMTLKARSMSELINDLDVKVKVRADEWP